MSEQMAREGMTGAKADMIEFLTSQHREVEQLWSQLEVSHRNGSTPQEDLFERIVALLSKHDALEAQFLYPELRESGGGQGEQLSEHSLDDHKEVRELLSQVDGADIRDDNVYSTMEKCLQSVMHHVEEEEDEVFPLLRSRCGEDRLMDLGQKMEQMMPMAPTHPHPHTPDSKIGATVAGAVSGVIDHARDAVRDKSSD
jgi:hemerythrin superfamily protein